MTTTYVQSPGVYVNEVNSLPSSVVSVPTSIPVFIGYTPQTIYEGTSLINQAIQINSLADFQSFFCLPATLPPDAPVKQYRPQYYLVEQKAKPAEGDYVQVGGNYYSVLPDPNTIYYLYNSIKLFYKNGGATAYVVSCGSYGQASGQPINPGDQIVNPNVKLHEVLGALESLKYQEAPTMYVCPDACLMTPEHYGSMMQSMLLQCSFMETAISILDVIGGDDPDPLTFMNDIDQFRTNAGSTGLNYGAVYYPFVCTSIMQQVDLSYTNLCGGDYQQLQAILSPTSQPNAQVDQVFSMIQGGPASNEANYNAALLMASTDYQNILNVVLNRANILPSSAAMAGVMTSVDNSEGVWAAPANVVINEAVDLPINLSESLQADLNVDPATGKSINAIRFFPNQGILVWGARTLDGNSLDWKYINVRRTVNFLEQSIKLAMRSFIFEPNNAHTWSAITSLISSFLQGFWSQGGLMGSTPADAFSVACGLNFTMDESDILNGFLIVNVQVAITHPAEFIVFTISQQQQTS